MTNYWQDKIALVIGGSMGLGRVLAERFADAGAQPVIAGLEGPELHEAAAAIGSPDRPVTAIATDATQQPEVDSLFQQVIDQYGRVDVVVNSIGISDRGRVLATTPERFQQLWELNFLAVVRCCSAAAEHLINSGGHLVNIGSLAAKSASRFLGAYPATKFPLAAYCQQLRFELQPQGVHVLLVCPGPIAREDSGSRYDKHAADLPEAARRPGAGVKLNLLCPNKLAGAVLQACQRRKPELVMPARTRLLFAISQLWPALGDRIILKMSRGD